jgi:hypothetical protein
MGAISRNQLCPCRSGRKYKHCCLPLREAGLPQPKVRLNRQQVSLAAEVDKVQQAAALRQDSCRELGVFILFSTQDGDAWVLETTERDAFQAAASGQPLPPPVHENREVIEVDWSHRFALCGRSLFLTDHESGVETELRRAPTMQISTALRRIKKQYPAELLRQVHLRSDPAKSAA